MSTQREEKVTKVIRKNDLQDTQVLALAEINEILFGQEEPTLPNSNYLISLEPFIDKGDNQKDQRKKVESKKPEIIQSDQSQIHRMIFPAHPAEITNRILMVEVAGHRMREFELKKTIAEVLHENSNYKRATNLLFLACWIFAAVVTMLYLYIHFMK